MEYVSSLITQYLAVEQTYLLKASQLTNSLRRSLIKLYQDILRYLIYHVELLDQNGFKAFVKRLDVNALKQLKTLLHSIESDKERVDSDAAHVNNEQTKQGIDAVQQRQEYLITQQRRFLKPQKELTKGQAELKIQQETIQHQIEGQFRCLQSVLQEWQEDTRGTQDQVSEIYSNIVEKAETKRISDWLSMNRQDLHHASAQTGILQSSGKWLLEHADFRDWKESPHAAVLWIHGLPGTGKTKLTSIIIETLKNNMRESDDPGHLAYFYCSRNEAVAERTISMSSRGEPVEILRSIVQQLAKIRGAGAIDVVVTSKYTQLKGEDTAEPRPCNMKECVNMIIALSRHSTTTIVVDGLDECNRNAVPELIQSFADIVQRSPKRVKIFLSTRYVNLIVDGLKQQGWSALEVGANKNSGDIARFVDHELERRIADKSLLHGDVSADLRQEISETLTHRAGSMFWYATLQLNLLCDPTAELDEIDVRRKLRESPQSLKAVYAEIVHEFESPKNSQRSRSVAQNTIMWLLCARESLNRGAFMEAVSDEPVDGKFITRVCRTLVVDDSDSGMFRFSHLSVREYFEAEENYQPSTQHLVAAERCLKMVETSLLSRALTQDLTPAKEAFKKYAFLNWPTHYQQIDFEYMDERKERLIAKLKNMFIQSSGVSPTFKQWISDVKTMTKDLPMSSSLKSLQADPDTPLFTACVFGFADLIKQFRRAKNFDLDQCNSQGQTGLCLAVANDHMEVVKSLLAKMSDRFAPSQDVNAVNQEALVQFDSEMKTSKSSGPFGDIVYATALQAAAAQGHLNMAQYLIGLGARRDSVAGYYGNALQAAALNGRDDIVLYLLEKDAEPNSQGGYYGNALQAAVVSGNVKSVQYLIEYGALVTAPGGWFGSALMAAVYIGSTEIMDLILSQNPHVNLGDERFGTPIQYAAKLNNEAMLLRLLSQGADITAGRSTTSEHGLIDTQSALAAAAWGGHSTIVSLLLSKGAQACTEYKENEFHILHQAAYKGMQDLVKYCLDQGQCDLEMKTTTRKYWPNNIVMTPLFFACAEGHQSTVSFMLERGASVQLDKQSVTGLWLATRGGHAETVETLIKHCKNHLGQEYTDRLLHFRSPSNEFAVLETATSIKAWATAQKLLHHGARWGANAGHETGLHRAARGDERLVREYIQAFTGFDQLGPLLESRNMFKRTPLHSAAEFNQPKIITLLLNAGADVMALEDKSRTALFWAAERNHTECMKVLIAHADQHPGLKQRLINHRSDWGRTALQEAIMRRHLPAVRLLVDHNADLMTSISGNDFPLLLTVKDMDKKGWKDCMPMANSIIQKAADLGTLIEIINMCSKDNESSLWWACENDLQDVVALLLDNRADYSLSSAYQVTPMHRACWLNRKEVVRVLLRHGSNDPDQIRFSNNLNLRDYWGRTALNAAAVQGNWEIVSMLLDHDADYAIACPGGNVPEPWYTPLHQAAARNKGKVAEVLLNHISRDVNRTKAQAFLDARIESIGNTTLMHVALKGYGNIVRMLLEAGADYTLQNNFGGTVLIHGACSGDFLTVQLILTHIVKESDKLKAEAFLNAKNGHGKTAFIDASERNFSTIVKALLETPGVDHTIRDKQGQTALHWCALHNSRRALAEILDFGKSNTAPVAFEAFINAPANDGRSALFMATAVGHFDITRVLLQEHKAVYDHGGQNGNSVLHAAVVGNQLSAAEVLLPLASAGRESDGGRFERFINHRNNEGKTALECAIERNDGRFMEVLKKYGAT